MSQRRRLLGSARFTALASYRNPPRSAAAASCRATRTAPSALARATCHPAQCLISVCLAYRLPQAEPVLPYTASNCIAGRTRYTYCHMLDASVLLFCMARLQASLVVPPGDEQIAALTHLKVLYGVYIVAHIIEFRA